MHIHLDLIGGIAGDMFVAALLDARPDLEKKLLETLNNLPFRQEIAIMAIPAIDNGISGKRFKVECIDTSIRHKPHVRHTTKLKLNTDISLRPIITGTQKAMALTFHPTSSHLHHSWRGIKQMLQNSQLAPQVKENAIGIFTLLANAEAKVHGMLVDDVVFHEVGAWDCIVDIVSASWLIYSIGITHCSISPVPWGGGTVTCAHGVIPVPAPATLNLLQGFRFVDDGISGERVTPTGAAILAWLKPHQTSPLGTLLSVGYGIGTKKLPNRANIVRATILENCSEARTEDVGILQCDIDDMTGEMLAIARENLRKLPGVHEITESVSHGKKNRLINTLTILYQPDSHHELIDTVFLQTSTIGVRHWRCQRTVLPRCIKPVQYGDMTYEVKTVQRPQGFTTSKIEAKHFIDSPISQSEREHIRQAVEQIAEK